MGFGSVNAARGTIFYRDDLELEVDKAVVLFVCSIVSSDRIFL